MSPNGNRVIIHKDKHAYTAHPSICMLSNGDWLAVVDQTLRQDVIHHPPEDPRYRHRLCRSTDRGARWEAEIFAPDFSWHGVECAGLSCISSGTVILSQFKYRWYPLAAAKKHWRNGELIWMTTSGHDFRTEITDRDWAHSVYPWARGIDGTYVHLSFDSGHSFEKTVKLDIGDYVNGYSRTGVKECSDGSLIYALAEVHIPEKHFYFHRSEDSGKTWSPPLPITNGPVRDFGEPDILETSPGNLLCVLRCNAEHKLFTCRSADNGASWTEPAETVMEGRPGHLLKLADGRILCSYGRRLDPYGIRLCLSEDQGRTWDIEREIIVRDDLPNGNLGYPTTIEYEPGKLFVCYYGQDTDGVTCVQGSYADLA